MMKQDHQKSVKKTVKKTGNPLSYHFIVKNNGQCEIMEFSIYEDDPFSVLQTLIDKSFIMEGDTIEMSIKRRG